MKVDMLNVTPYVLPVILTTRQTVFCDCSDSYDGRKSEFSLIPVRTLALRETILKACEKHNNEWVGTVKQCILFAPDPPAANVVYHQKCSVNFKTRQQILQICSSSQSDTPRVAKCPKLSGRPKDEVRYENFLQVVRYLEENDNEQISIYDLTLKFVENPGICGVEWDNIWHSVYLCDCDSVTKVSLQLLFYIREAVGLTILISYYKPHYFILDI